MSIALEVDGPVHFHANTLATPTWTPSNSYRDSMLLDAGGFDYVIHVPYWEIDVLEINPTAL